MRRGGAARAKGRSTSLGVVSPGAVTRLLAELAHLPEEELAGGWEGGLRAGDVVGRFELVREIGRGGFGVVWEARDQKLGRSVAFKSVRAGGPAGVLEERLLREAEAAAQLTHPNIVTLHDVGRCERGPYLVMELLRGQSLADRLDSGPVDPPTALRLAREVARGVAHAHAQGVVHRDLKPENVFLCDDGQVKVVDFGLAHALGRRRLEGGTPAYMAPEQRRGDAEDERTDVYALGVLFHRLAAGELPAAAEEGQPPPLLRAPELPGLPALVHAMLQPDPAQRPRDGRAVLEALSGIERAIAAPAGARRPWGRRGAALAAVGLALLAAAAAGLLARRPAVAPAPASDAAGDAALAADPAVPRSDEQIGKHAIAYGLYVRGLQAQGELMDGPLARRLFRHAIAFEPGWASPRLELALLGDDPEALAGRSPPGWARQLPPRDQQLLRALRARGEEGRRLFTALLAAYPEDKEIAYVAGRAAEADGDLWTAFQCYQMALLLDPAYLPALEAGLYAWRALGVWGRADELARMGERAVAVRPSPATQAYLALGYALRSDREEALRVARLARQVREGAPALSLHVGALLAGVFVDAGDAAAAEELLRPWAADEVEPSVRRQGIWELGRLLAAEGRVRDLRALAAAVDPGQGPEQAALADALRGAAAYAAGDDAGAAAAWSAALARAPGDPSAGVDPALAASLGDAAAARRACARVAPGQWLACEAVVQWKGGARDGALAALRRAVSQGWAPHAELLMGEVQAEGGDAAQAAAALERYLDAPDGLDFARPRARALLARLQERLGREADARDTRAALERSLGRADADLALRAELGAPPTRRR